MDKPGIKTTEFWIAVIAQLIPLLVMFGVLTADEGSALADAVSKAVAAVVALVAAVWPIVAYIKSRTAVKTALLAPAAIELIASTDEEFE